MKKQKKQQIDLLKTLKKLDSTTKKEPKTPKNGKQTNPLIVLFVFAIIITGIVYFFNGPTRDDIKTELGLNDIQARYAS